MRRPIIFLAAISSCVLFLLFPLVLPAAPSSAGTPSMLTLNEAVDAGMVRIVRSQSAGGYSRFLIEMENATNTPLSIDPYGSAFDPPSGVKTQRVGIGLPVKIGNDRVDLRRALSTNVRDEAPVGAAAGAGPGTIPDGALPAAAGAAAGAAAIGTLLTGLAQGVRPREALSELAGLVRGEETPPPDAPPDNSYQIGIIKSYRDQDMSDLDYQRQRLEAARAQGAQDVARDAEAAVTRLTRQINNYDRNLADLGEKPLEHQEGQQRSFDFKRRDLGQEVKAELADKAAGTISDSDRTAINLWIADNAPTEQSYNDMKGLVDGMVVTTGDGTVLGDKNSILKSLGNELQRTNQPHLTYSEKYALREELMDSAKGEDSALEKAKEAYDDGKDVVTTVTGPSERVEDANKTYQEGWEKDGASPGGDAMKNVEKAKKLYDAGQTIYGDTKGYMAAGNSRSLALTKAVTQYGVDLGVNTLMEKNPVMKVVNTTLKYSEKVVGKDISPARGWRILTDKAFDTATGELDHKDAAKLDFNSTEVKGAVKDAQVKALQKRLTSTSLSDAGRQEATGLLKRLKGS